MTIAEDALRAELARVRVERNEARAKVSKYSGEMDELIDEYDRLVKAGQALRQAWPEGWLGTPPRVVRVWDTLVAELGRDDA